MGGFKPVDVRRRLWEIYSKFLPLFREVFKGFENKEFVEKLNSAYEDTDVENFSQILDFGIKSCKKKLKSQPSKSLQEFELFYSEHPLPANPKSPIFQF